MLPINHLLLLTPNRIAAAVNRLQESIWHDFIPLRVEATESREQFVALDEAGKLPRHPVSPGTAWGGLFDQRWCRIELPEKLPDDQWFLNWREQGEGTLYLDGTPYFGFDVAHRHCRLPSEIGELWMECSCVQSAIWHKEATGLDANGNRFDGAFICRRDEIVWRAYHDLKCLFDLMLDERRRENPMLSQGLAATGPQATLDRVSPFYRRLLRLLDDAVNALDRQGPAALSHSLSAAYAELRNDKTFQRCVLTGHAHIDLVWLWPERIGELKAVHVFSTVNRLMEEYSEFKFAYSQPASYEAVARRSPQLYRDIRQRIRDERWQATGAMYVESDTSIATGEALARSFILGQDGFLAIGGRTSPLTWLPDVFGYSGNLPQLMKLSGVDYFFTTKMTWNMVNRFPYSSFIWRGVDGSEIVAHVRLRSWFYGFSGNCQRNCQRTHPERLTFILAEVDLRQLDVRSLTVGGKGQIACLSERTTCRIVAGFINVRTGFSISRTRLPANSKVCAPRTRLPRNACLLGRIKRSNSRCSTATWRKRIFPPNRLNWPCAHGPT
jgi:alpha-mannosidase